MEKIPWNGDFFMRIPFFFYIFLYKKIILIPSYANHFMECKRNTSGWKKMRTLQYHQHV